MNQDFYTSIDRLVEFGLSNKLAKAMMETMNSTMASMQMPNYSQINQIAPIPDLTAIPQKSPKRFFVGINDNPVGPLDTDELKQKIALKEITPETLIWYQGLPGWAQAKTLSEVNILFSQVPPTMPSSQPE